MLKFTPAQQQKIMYRLRCTAEKDPSDTVANAASQLAYELEYPQRINQLTDVDKDLIRYAHRMAYTPTSGVV